MRILVTGGAGFIGSNLVRALLDEYEVGVIDDLSTGTTDNLPPEVWFRQADILDKSFPGLVEEFAPAAIVHLAAQASVGESIKDPARDWAVNADGTGIVAAAASAAGAHRVISASSAAVYGEPAELPLAETSQKIPENPYGRSKLAAEEILAAGLVGTGTDFASFRFANVYGPRQDARGEGGVIAIFCDRLSQGHAPVIYGTGEQTRDFIYVGDVVAAIVAALASEARLSDGAGGGPAYNISTGIQSDVSAVAKTLRSASELASAIKYAPKREGDVMASVLDPTKARSVFKWDARVSLDIGLKRTYQWFAAQE